MQRPDHLIASRIMFPVLVSCCFLAGCLGPTTPTPQVLLSSFEAYYSPAASNPDTMMDGITMEVVGFEGRFAKTFIIQDGAKHLQYFYWEAGAWKPANFVDDPSAEDCQQLGMPKALWP